MTFTPSDVGGLVTWLRASDLTGLSNGDPVTTWTDNSGNSLPAVQIPGGVCSIATRPTYVTGQTTAGGVAVRFQKSLNQGLYFVPTNPLSAMTAAEIVIYFRTAGSGVETSALYNFAQPTYIPHSSALVGYDGGLSSSGHSFALPIEPTDWTTYNTSARPGLWRNFFDGELITADTTDVYRVGSPPFPNDYEHTVGCWIFPDGGQFMDGYVAEFMVFDHVLSGADRLLVRDYLLERHEGVTPPDHLTAGARVSAYPGGDARARKLLSSFVDTFTGPDYKPIWQVEPYANDDDHLPVYGLDNDRHQVDFDATWGYQEVDLTTDPEEIWFEFDEFSYQAYVDDFDPDIYTEVYFSLDTNYPGYPSGRVAFDIYQGTLAWYWQWYTPEGGSLGDDGDLPYDPVAHAFVKANRDEDGYVHFFASPDGTTWNELMVGSVPMPLITNGSLYLSLYHDEDGGRMADMAWVDNFNGLTESGGALPEEFEIPTAVISLMPGEYIPIELDLVTASITIAAEVTTVEIEAAGVYLDGATAELQIQASPLSRLPASYTVGDPFAAPYVISGSTGTFDADITTTTVEDNEPDLGTSLHSYWARYTPAYNGILTLTSPTDDIGFAIDVYTGAAIDSAERIGTVTYPGGDPLDIPVGANQPLSIRVRGLTLDDTGTVTVAWTLTSTIYDAILQLRDTQLRQAPGALVASAFNFAPNTSLTFRVNGISVYTAVTDDTGTLAYVSIPVDDPLDVGTYSLSVTASDTASGTFTETAATTFTVLNPPLDVPTPSTPDTSAPVEVEQLAVIRWVFQDPLAGGLGSYRVPINPSEMSTPRAPKAISVDHTTAADGQALFWQGGHTAHQWTFRGYLETEEHYLKLAAFAALNRRFWIIDHRERGWVVTITTFDPSPKRNIYMPWAHEYEISALIYRGPVTPE